MGLLLCFSDQCKKNFLDVFFFFSELHFPLYRIPEYISGLWGVGWGMGVEVGGGEQLALWLKSISSSCGEANLWRRDFCPCDYGGRAVRNDRQSLRGLMSKYTSAINNSWNWLLGCRRRHWFVTRITKSLKYSAACINALYHSNVKCHSNVKPGPILRVLNRWSVVKKSSKN